MGSCSVKAHIQPQRHFHETVQTDAFISQPAL